MAPTPPSLVRTWSMVERRNFPRVGMRLKLSYTILGTKKIGTALTSNLSGAGIRFQAEHHLEPGTQLDVVLSLPEREEPVRFLEEKLQPNTRRKSKVEMFLWLCIQESSQVESHLIEGPAP
jgi:hypothetical protein